MKILRIEKNGHKVTLAKKGEKIYLISDALEFLLKGASESLFLAEVNIDLERILSGKVPDIKVLTPYDPPEIWGSGISYYISRQRYSEENVARIGGKTIYEAVYDAERPEIFFKGTSRCAVGHNSPINVRSDSEWTLPEPELAVVLDHTGKILAYTVFDDVSARDIEAENPLYLPQSKIYDGSSAFGPFLVTPDEFGNPYSKTIELKIYRNGNLFFRGQTSTSNMKTPIEKQIKYLIRNNSIPDGTLLTTGTAIVPGRDQGLRDGDIVEITIEGIGTLVTPVRHL